MPRTRTADSGEPVRGGVTVSGRPAPLRREQVERAAATVLRAEHREALLSISFVGRARMRALNRRWKGTDRETDVLAFALHGPGGTLAGDIYVCPWVAAMEASARGVRRERELLRLVVHGVLHVLGYDHPAGPGRSRSPMWRRQERYLRGLR